MATLTSSKSKSKSKKTLFNVGQCKQYNMDILQHLSYCNRTHLKLDFWSFVETSPG